MSIKSVIVKMAEVTKDEIHCDGPNHVGDTLMEYDSITVRGGFGSYIDCQRFDFCEMACLADWAQARRG